MSSRETPLCWAASISSPISRASSGPSDTVTRTFSPITERPSSEKHLSQPIRIMGNHSVGSGKNV